MLSGRQVGEVPGGPTPTPDHLGDAVLTFAAAWVALSIPAALLIGRWLRGLDCCDHPEAG